MLVIVAATSLGCASASYYASDLPPELQAPELPGGVELDLAKFAKPTSTTDLVEPGDVLEVSVATGLEGRFSPRWTLRVDDQGAVTVPIVGPVRVGGLALSDADRAIYDAAVSRGFYRNPNVAVTRVDRRESRIIVAGAVKKPGAYDLPASSSDVLSALVAAGGLSPDADTIVEVRQPASRVARRGGPDGAQFASHHTQSLGAQESQEFQLDLAQSQYIEDWDVTLTDGAVISVRERPNHVVAVMGKVKKPGQFDLPKDREMRFLDAISLAGGQSMSLADKAYVVRQASEGAEPVLIRVSIRDAKSDPNANLRLAPGDVVSVEETPLTLGVETLSKMIRVGLTSRVGF